MPPQLAPELRTGKAEIDGQMANARKPKKGASEARNQHGM
jgi:hypothetical protein